MDSERDKNVNGSFRMDRKVGRRDELWSEMSQLKTTWKPNTQAKLDTRSLHTITSPAHQSNADSALGKDRSSVTQKTDPKRAEVGLYDHRRVKDNPWR